MSRQESNGPDDTHAERGLKRVDAIGADRISAQPIDVRLGYRAGICPDVSTDDTEALVAIREAFARHDVLIAEVGAWRNIQTPDADVRKRNLAYVVHQLSGPPMRPRSRRRAHR